MFSQYGHHILRTLCVTSMMFAASCDAKPEHSSRNEAEQLYPTIPKELRPSLAIAGSYQIGVRTVEFTHANQLDINTQQVAERRLTVELWYPAAAAPKQPPTSYASMTKSQQPFTIQAKAVRNSAPIDTDLLPIVILSHGYPGNRYLMFYLAEHLASHGYLVAAIDHPHSTYAEIDQQTAPYQGFLNTLYHRSRDQQFVLNSLRQQAEPAVAFLQNRLELNAAAVIGYSMGGYGAMNTIGACLAFTEAQLTVFTGQKDTAAMQALAKQLNTCAGGQAKSTAKVDATWQAAVAIAPWGGQHQLFAADSLQQITTPLLVLAGDQDTVSGYDGMRWLYEQAGSRAKYFLTYQQAQHNIAPHPAPSVSRNLLSDFTHYHEPNWSIQAINDVNRHLITLMLDCHVKDHAASCLQLQQGAAEKPWPGYNPGLPTGLSWRLKLPD